MDRGAWQVSLTRELNIFYVIILKPGILFSELSIKYFGHFFVFYINFWEF